MKAVVYSAPREFAVRDVPTPEPGPREVRVKVTQTGVCGTDLHLHEGQFLAAYPMIPGHETVGVVDCLGHRAEGFQLGEQVVINPNTSCGNCPFCREGRPLMCEHIKGMGSNRPGGFAEYVVAPVESVFSAEGMHPDLAVFTEPAACAMHGVDVVRPTPGSKALVLGAGPTGLLLAQLLGSSGAAHVTVAAPVDFQLKTATALGVDATYEMDRGRLAGDVADLLALSGGGGYDIVVDATGVARVSEATVALTRNGGTALLYGVADENDRIQVSPYEIFRRELTIKGSFAEIDSFPAALAALRSGRARTDDLITHRFPLDDYGLALETVRGGAAHKVVITL
ncbi:zinc-dependent alcohol dehydrogenase family protein [Streptomyces sp. NPDC096311]|uniref:zinc-dependent alcohol dehydrogenase family protein n=1 Tax=Streptomyces sp. NPDC096311 TaxID=3366083 RepID=UPI003819F63C